MIIGFGYRAQSGKDTAADFLVKNYGFTKRSFASSLKEAAQIIFGLTDEQLHTMEGKERVDPFWEVTSRYILQRFGTECLRNGYSQDVWVKSLHRHIMQRREQVHWVIPDVRFPNEAQAIKEWGGAAVHIQRPGFDELGHNVGIKGHASETAMDTYDGWDHTIVNGGSVQVLEERLSKLMAEFTIAPKSKPVPTGQVGQS